jgi:ABC-type transport system involved in cytochrome c biogenesis ATPase subunit
VEFTISTLPRGAWPPDLALAHSAYLQPDNWDDFHYRTTFTLWVRHPVTGKAVDVGITKIATHDLVVRGNEAVSVSLPATFKKLSSSHFSVGQDRDYYTKLINALGIEEARKLLRALNDLALAPDTIPRLLLNSDAARTSLFRTLSPQTVADQFSRILKGGAEKEQFSLTYSPVGDDVTLSNAPEEMVFSVRPATFLPSNLHVIIGANGVGKTTAIRRIRESLKQQRHHSISDGYVKLTDAERVSSLLTVSFSAFDSGNAGRDLDKGNFRIVDVGLAEIEDSLNSAGGTRPKLSSQDVQAARFRENVNACLLDRRERLSDAMRQLARADITLDGYGIGDPNRLLNVPFSDLSSGHKVVLLAVTTLVRHCEERSLVLIDEPEAHLHPPLLSAFTRVISELVADRNGLGIVATHSPIVLQEVPRTCAWVLWRQDPVVRVLHPRINTFGESVDVLTREVFGLQLREAGYYTLLEKAAKQYASYEKAVEAFGGELGSDARFVLRALMAAEESDEW